MRLLRAAMVREEYLRFKPTLFAVNELSVTLQNARSQAFSSSGILHMAKREYFTPLQKAEIIG
jgi:hypothetical protein